MTVKNKRKTVDNLPENSLFGVANTFQLGGQPEAAAPSLRREAIKSELGGINTIKGSPNSDLPCPSRPRPRPRITRHIDTKPIFPPLDPNPGQNAMDVPAWAPPAAQEPSLALYVDDHLRAVVVSDYGYPHALPDTITATFDDHLLTKPLSLLDAGPLSRCWRVTEALWSDVIAEADAAYRNASLSEAMRELVRLRFERLADLWEGIRQGL